MGVWDCFSIEPLDEEAHLEVSDLDEPAGPSGVPVAAAALDEWLPPMFDEASDDADMEWALSDAALGGQPAPAEIAAAAQGEVDEEAPKRKRCRRVAGDKAVAAATRSEICKAAAHARWDQRASASAPAAGQAQLQAADAPNVTDIFLIDGCRAGADASLVLAVTRPVLGRVEPKVESKLHKYSKQLISGLALSKQLGIHQNTVQRKMRLMASVIVLGTKFRALKSCQLVHMFLQQHCVSVVPSLYVV